MSAMNSMAMDNKLAKTMLRQSVGENIIYNKFVLKSVVKSGTNNLYVLDMFDIKEFDMKSGAVVKEFAKSDGHIYNDFVVGNHDLSNEILIIGSFGKIKLWNLNHDRGVAELKHNTLNSESASVAKVIVGHDTNVLCSQSAKTINIWDINTRQCTGSNTISHSTPNKYYEGPSILRKKLLYVVCNENVHDDTSNIGRFDIRSGKFESLCASKKIKSIVLDGLQDSLSVFSGLTYGGVEEWDIRQLKKPVKVMKDDRSFIRDIYLESNRLYVGLTDKNSSAVKIQVLNKEQDAFFVVDSLPVANNIILSLNGDNKKLFVAGALGLSVFSIS